MACLSDMGAQYVTLMTDNNAVSISNGTAFRLPNGLFIDNQDSWQWGASSNGAMMMTTYGTGNASKTVSMQDLDTLIWSLGILKVSPNPTNDTAEWPDLPVSATECALYYCINRYDTTVRNGTLHETATPVADAKRAVDSWQPVDFPESWRALNNTMLASIEFDEYFSCIERSDLVLEAPDGERFNVSQNAVDSISAYFKSTFETSLRSYNETNQTVEGQINGWYMNSTTIQYKPSAIQPFYKSDDLNATFKTLATSMTNALRSDADSNGVTLFVWLQYLDSRLMFIMERDPRDNVQYVDEELWPALKSELVAYAKATMEHQSTLIQLTTEQTRTLCQLHNTQDLHALVASYAESALHSPVPPEDFNKFQISIEYIARI
ncbi:hypothetical protein SLS56_008316 [Neofusicoccum ribis]|uniref:Uncharacterized protein n=1 Tax=Neofusicoccum ribis TaxID=45134 RepID=A0ABR3SKY0_9PEZI